LTSPEELPAIPSLCGEIDVFVAALDGDEEGKDVPLAVVEVVVVVVEVVVDAGF
jgi:hypothetical protein